MNKLLKEIVNGEFINVVYDDEVYLFVDEFIYKNKYISYFNSLHGDLFCYRKGNLYEVIEDETLCEKVREENDLYMDFYLYYGKNNKNGKSYEITGGERNLIIENFISDLSKLGEVDRNLIYDLLKDTTFKRSLNYNCYNTLSNVVYLKDPKKSNIVFHELIHVITNKDYKTNFLVGHGLLEGYASLLTNKIYTKNISGVYNNLEYNFDPHLVGNCNECTLIASELEFLTGEDAYNMIYNSDIKNIEKICNKIGLNAYLYVRYGLNKIYKKYKKGKYCNGELLVLEDVILHNAFDREFNLIKNKEDAYKYFDKLNNFGYYRVKVGGRDSLLEEYFNQKLEEYNNKFNTNLNVEYKEANFNNRYLEYEYDKRICNDMKSYLNMSNDVYDCHVYRLNKNGNVYGIFVINESLLYVKKYDLNGSRRVNIDFDLSDAYEIVLEDKIVRKR